MHTYDNTQPPSRPPYHVHILAGAMSGIRELVRRSLSFKSKKKYEERLLEAALEGDAVQVCECSKAHAVLCMCAYVIFGSCGTPCLLLWVLDREIYEFRIVFQVAALAPKCDDVSKPREDGCTPLHAACNGGFTECVRLLLEAGADASKLFQGWTALHVAAAAGRHQIALVHRRFNH